LPESFFTGVCDVDVDTGKWDWRTAVGRPCAASTRAMPLRRPLKTASVAAVSTHLRQSASARGAAPPARAAAAAASETRHHTMTW
jgi:hypothetical protein